MTAEAARPRGRDELERRAVAALAGRPEWLVWVPGRIEFLGKHTDYAGGRSLVCPVDRGFVFAVAPRADERLLVHDAVSGEPFECAMDASAPLDASGWGVYPATVARRVALNFPGARGADLTFASDLPRAAGMSSSSALVTGTFLALSAVNDLPARPEYRAAISTPEDLAGYLGTIENGQSFPGLPGERGVGTFGGSEDHTAMICGRDGALVQYSYAPVRFERAIPIPSGHVFAIASSGVVARKTGDARERYNALSRMTLELLKHWNAATGRADPTLAAAVASSPEGADRLRDVVARMLAGNAATGFEAAGETAALGARLEHFLLESEDLVPTAGEALLRGDLTALGPIVQRSQAGAERLLGNQVPETVWLARRARELGAVAASAFGAGFGGSVWALVPAGSADQLAARWLEEYAHAFPRRTPRARCFVTRPGERASVARVA